MRRRSRLERLLLAVDRRPGGQRDDLERRRNAAVGTGEALGVNLAGAQQCCPAQWRAAALGEHIGGAHGAQVVHEGERVWVGDGEAVAVDDGEREARALQQAAEVAAVREWRDAGAGAAVDLTLGGDEGLTQLGQALAADQGCEQQAVGFQRMAGLHECAREVVDPLQRQGRDDQIETGGLEGKQFFVGLHASVRRTAQKCCDCIHLDDEIVPAALAQPPPD